MVKPFVVATAKLNPDGGLEGKIEIAVYIFVIFLIIALLFVWGAMLFI
jgi:hypothetical protein